MASTKSICRQGPLLRQGSGALFPPCWFSGNASSSPGANESWPSGLPENRLLLLDHRAC